MKIEPFSQITRASTSCPILNLAQQRKKKNTKPQPRKKQVNPLKLECPINSHSKVLKLNFKVDCSLQDSHDIIVSVTYIRPDNSSASKGRDLKLLRQTVMKSVG